MLFNVEKNKIKTTADCLECKFFDQVKKKCVGLNINCFEYDDKTMTIIDSVTKLSKKV